MDNFNLCEAFFSGYYFFREEFASCALGYALSPFSTGTAEPLKYFIQKLIESQDEYHDLLKEVLKKLDSVQPADWKNTFSADPLSGNRITSALEFNEIDILLKIDDIILLFENKIFEGSVGDIAKQITDYKNTLPDKFKGRVIPIAVFPKNAKNDYRDIISIAWNESKKGKFSLCEFFKTLSEKYPVLKDFIELIENEFSLSGRSATLKGLSYNELINKFDGDFPTIIRQLFPEENYAPGDDMNIGGCLLYRLPLNNSKTECFPFRLMVNGKCEILFQGLRKKVFFRGEKFDGKHTIRDIIKEYLLKHGVSFTDRYHFSYREFAKTETAQAFQEVIALLQRIDREEWDNVKFSQYYQELTQSSITPAELKERMQELLAIPADQMSKNRKQLEDLAVMISAVSRNLS